MINDDMIAVETAIPHRRPRRRARSNSESVMQRIEYSPIRGHVNVGDRLPENGRLFAHSGTVGGPPQPPGVGSFPLSPPQIGGQNPNRQC